MPFSITVNNESPPVRVHGSFDFEINFNSPHYTNDNNIKFLFTTADTPGI